ncbi:uncharacterized protein LOC117640616 [Thrips palmi]|uniref:Uncharacterized protein LOC117640616 n=1 Tax=Thrips palmi TaxID=161013 RepID=A0A6P8ZI81_THRPL|nr:uncharacterized protein LOC117640616 [Thrips palmi]XP_034233130.1 uncharacterized protein LOC117640616 [Thrips palmi]XP_034233131.1 uncharacterized protein LOC117640616 [Thrips palmi]XP_034233132.1 uncharacterized protein LOC117640616 [Thrips palmi]XP_034233133.1 uncharacterized protein LOC117640616 [Thrips palmi]XP_034233134.1 uncharacterized protein LOC117640616 [Thrips palmi]XP_034233135.1 uncharacterized protein LOC117640616 [Thrips palmi]XP_034233136.1 uncharacterized protein LOC1176
MDQSLLLALPDDALLAVLAFLPPRQLFDCRVLCRRLRDLCLHPDLWRRIRVARAWKNLGLSRSALRLAPCLRELDISGIDLEDAATEVSRTSCVVAKLRIAVDATHEVTFATAIVEKVSALGGLEELDLPIRVEEGVVDVNGLLGAMYKADRLRKLRIAGEGRVASISGLEMSPFLTELTCERLPCDALVEHLLEAHAATLERVHFTMMMLPVSALLMLPRLRSFECGSCEEYVLWLPEFLREASQLRSVTLAPCRWFIDPEAIPALATSPSARVLESLKLHVAYEKADFWCQLAAAVPEFTALRTLSLKFDGFDLSQLEPCFDLMRALNPTTAPSLTTLEMIGLPIPSRRVCVHAWLHDPAVEELLKRNPRLHLRLRDFFWNPDCTCTWCKKKCHSDIWRSIGWVRGRAALAVLSDIRWRSEGWVAFAAHSRGAYCLYPSECSSWP